MSRGRVGLVVTELLGLVKTGGIATATTHMAIVLSRAGYEVDCYYCGWAEAMDPEWAPLYRDAGVRIHWLDRQHAVSPATQADSYRLYEQLRGEELDTIVFQDWQGLAYFSALARSAGLAFARTRLVHIVHGPVDWLDEANRSLEVDAATQTTAFMERRSAELADTVVGPSRYLVDWMAAQGWQLPDDRRFIPYFTAGHLVDLDPEPSPTRRPGGQPLDDIVFFGRLEERKGVRIFVDALNRIGGDRLAGLTITFLGRDAMFSHDDVRALFTADVASAATIRFLSDLDQRQARAHLAGPGVLAVMPSILDNSPNVVYECIEDQIPFLVSTGGGSGELVAESDRSWALFEPTGSALAEALGRVVDRRVTPEPPGAAFNGQASFDAWCALLDQPVERPPRAIDQMSELPLVSVVVPLFNQFEAVRVCLDSVAAQDYPNLEIIVVDDGSTRSDASEQLDDLEHWRWGRDLRVVRQENRYLGAARNTGVREAKGEYVAFVDDDDVLDPRYVTTMVTAALETGARGVTSAIAMYPTDRLGRLPAGGHEGTFAFLGGGAEHLGMMYNVFGGAAMMVRRQDLLDLGGFHERAGVGHEDWALLARLVLSGRSLFAVPEHGYLYRVRPGSMIRSTSTYQNMQPVYEAYDDVVPPGLRPLVRLAHGQTEIVERSRSEVHALHSQYRHQAEEFELRTRYVAVLGEALGIAPGSAIDVDEP